MSAATLTWKRETWRHSPGYLWRLYAPESVLSAIGGAPCHVGEMIGTCAYGGPSYHQDKRGWQASAELTPYDSEMAPVRGRDYLAMRGLEALIRKHLNGLGFESITFATETPTP